MGIFDFIFESVPEKPAPRGKVIMQAKGPGAELLLLEDRIRISRKGSFERTFQGDTEILLSQISAVELREAGRLMPGHLRLSLSGRGSGILDSTIDRADTTIRFGSKQQKEFAAIKEAIDERIASRTPPTP